MRLNRLAVTDYRNLSAAVLEPAPQLTVLCGANGQGKTNLLEAVWLLTGGKSFRGAKDAELIRRGADFAVLEAAFEAGNTVDRWRQRNPAPRPDGTSERSRPRKSCFDRRNFYGGGV